MISVDLNRSYFCSRLGREICTIKALLQTKLQFCHMEDSLPFGAWKDPKTYLVLVFYHLLGRLSNIYWDDNATYKV